MKIRLCLGVCALLTSGLAAAADTGAQAHYTITGHLCTADEIATPPVAKMKSRGRRVEVQLQCRTKAEWSILRAAKAVSDREWDDWDRRSLGGEDVLTPLRPSTRGPY